MSQPADQPTPSWSAIPFYRKNVFNALAVLFVSPLALGLMWTGPIYSRRKGEVAALARRDKIILSVVAVLSLLFGLSKLGGETDPNLAKGLLPACDSKTAISTMKGAAKDAPRSLRVEDILSVSDVSVEYQRLNWQDFSKVFTPDPNPNSRECLTTVLTNAGKKEIYYSMTWKDRQSGAWYLEANWR